MTALEAVSIAFAYEPGRRVFSDLDAGVSTGAVVGIIGPNGSGKSTLLRVLSGLLRPQTGRVLLDGSPLSSIASTERARKLAFLPQAVNPAFALSAFEVVCLGRYPYIGALGGIGPHDRAVAERCLLQTDALELRNRDFLSLSGGERQRVLLASVLAQEPALVLLDEPTAALDIHHQVEVFALLRRLAADGYGVAVVTHDLNLAGQFCDRLLLLGEGRVIAAGRQEDVLTAELLTRAYGAPIRVDRHPALETPLIWAEPAGTPREQRP